MGVPAPGSWGAGSLRWLADRAASGALIVADVLPAALGVLDSGSPISVASADLLAFLGVDVEADDPLYEIP